jgi:hypothetical protein
MRRAAFGEVVAAAEFILQRADGDRRQVQICIGAPYAVSAAEWACPAEIVRYEPRYPDVSGATSLQALCLAVGLVRSRVEDFMTKGGRVIVTEDDVTCDADDIAATFGFFGPG